MMMRLRRARTASTRLPARDTAPGVSSCNVPRRSARESDERVKAYSRHLSQSFCSSSARDPIDREETRSAIPAVPTIISAIPIPCVGLVVGWLGGLLSLAVLWRPGAPSSPRVDPPRIPFGNAAQVRRGGYLGLGSRRVRFPCFLARRTDEAGRTSPFGIAASDGPSAPAGEPPWPLGLRTGWPQCVCFACRPTKRRWGPQRCQGRQPVSPWPVTS